MLVTRITLRDVNGGVSAVSTWQDLLRRTREVPGVQAASLASTSLFSGNPSLMGLRTNGAPANPPDPTAGIVFISTGYFNTLGIHLVRGRDFDMRDNNVSAPPSAIANEAFVRKFFGGADPLGRKITKMANAPLWTTIVGIVEDAKFDDIRRPAPPLLYIPYAWWNEWIPPQFHPAHELSLQVRGAESASALASWLRRQAGGRFLTGEPVREQQLIGDTLVRERLLANVAGLFGVLALVLAALGVYGMVSYAVAERRREIGVRMAVGAAPRSILELMIGDCLLLTGAGILAGVIAGLVIARLANALLYGLAPSDFGTYVAAAGILLVVSLSAALIPAYRATKIDPIAVLRHE